MFIYFFIIPGAKVKLFVVINQCFIYCRQRLQINFFMHIMDLLEIIYFYKKPNSHVLHNSEKKHHYLSLMLGMMHLQIIYLMSMRRKILLLFLSVMTSIDLCHYFILTSIEMFQINLKTQILLHLYFYFLLFY